MKFKISKKIVSLFLAVMMVITSVTAFAINASAAVYSTDVSVLAKANDAYKEKMQNGDIMTNMKAAYDAYVNAQKAIDACTAVNPSSYGYESNVTNAVKDCGDAIKAAMGKTYSVTADDTRY